MNVATLTVPVALLVGLAALWLELAWLRDATSALPGTVPAGALVVPALLAAWAVGSAVAGRQVDGARSRLGLAARWFGLGAAAVLVGDRLGGLLSGATPPEGLGGRLLVGALPVLPAAFLLGGGLPLLARVRRDHGLAPERAAGVVAAAVALGGWLALQLWMPLLAEGRDPADLAMLALAGACLACVGLRVVDERQRAREAATSAASADAAVVADDSGVEHAPTPLADAPAGGRGLRLLLGAACVVGGAALVVGQLGVLRAQAQVGGDSMASTVDVLGGLHGGMALGAWALAFVTWRAAGGLVALLLAVAAFALLGPARGLDPWWAACALGLGAGSLVTAASRVPSAAARFGRWVGDLSALATLGSVLGGLLMSLVLVPRVGTGAGLHGLAWALSGVALLCALSARRRPLAAGTGLLAAVVVAGVTASTSVYTPPWRAGPEEVELIEQREGPWGVVSLVRTSDDQVRLKLDNRFGLGGSARPLLEYRMGRVAAALAPEASRALLLGLGRGHTLAGLATTSRAHVDCVERNGEVLAMDLPLPVEPGMSRGGEPRVHHADARQWLAQHDGVYDLVVGDLFFPWVSGAGELLAREHFSEVSERLAPDGVFVQWLPLHQIPWPAFGSVARSFISAFPTARAFVVTPLADVPLVALVGGLVDGLPDGLSVDELLAGAPSPAGPGGMPDLLDLHVCDAWALQRRFLDEPENTRARPLSELQGLAHQGDETWVARTNLRQLAALVEPLEVTSLTRRPAATKESRQLGFELQARGEALAGLLRARAARLELAALPARRDAAGTVRDRVADLEAELDGSLFGVWHAFPGHMDGRRALLERSTQLTEAERWLDAGGLLSAVLERHGDGKLGAVLGGVFVRLGQPDEALVVLEQARALLPRDRSVLVNTGAALLHAGRHVEAVAVLQEARQAFAPKPLPALLGAALALLEQVPGAEEQARLLLEALPADEPWRDALQALMGSV